MAFAHQNFFCIIQIRFISSWHFAYAFTFVKWFCACGFLPIKKYAVCGDFSLVRSARSTLVSFYILLLMKTKFNGLQQQNETNTRWIEMEVVIS